MAMLPFCGYNMADYFGHWLKIGETPGAQLPRVFYVNWFRKDDDGSFLWPGFGENSRVLEWIFRRCEDAVDAVDTPIGLVPRLQDLNTKGLELPPEALEALLTVDADLARGRAAADPRAPRSLRRSPAADAARRARRARAAPQRVARRPNASSRAIHADASSSGAVVGR